MTISDTCTISTRQATAARCTSKDERRRIEARKAVFTPLRFAIKEKNTSCIARNARADGRRDEYSVTPPRSDDTVAIDQ
jgi:hypothetical protein